MVPYEEIGEILSREAQERAAGLGAEQVAAASSLGRIVWSDVHAEQPVPVADRSAEGGFVVSAVHTEHASTSQPAFFRILDSQLSGTSGGGLPEAYEVMAGESLRPGLGDAVVGLHEVEVQGDVLGIRRPVRAGECIRRVGAEIGATDVIVQRGEPFSVADLILSTAAGVREVAVCPRLTFGLLVAGEPPGLLADPYSPIFLSTANDMDAVVSEVVTCPLNEDQLGEQIQRLVGLDLDCIVVVSSMPGMVRTVSESLGMWVLFDSPAVSPLQATLFGSFRGRRSVLFSVSSPIVSFAASLRFLLGPYVERVTGCRRRSPIKASLSHLVEKPTDRGAILLAQLVARRGEFLVTILQDVDAFAVAPLKRASCWAYLPPGRGIFERGDLVDVESLMPHFSRRSIVQPSDGEDSEG